VLSPDDVTALLCGAEAFSPSVRSPWRHLVVAVLFKVLYCLGLRPCEALRLSVSDVDLGAGTITVYQAKGDKDRMVWMSEDLREVVSTYDRAVSVACPDRTAFFPNGRGGHYRTASARSWFITVWGRVPSLCARGAAPPMLSLRHTFACERIRLWAAEGRELRSCIYYLVEHMGHASIKETEHYLHLVPTRFPEMMAKVSSLARELYPEVV
jgi:integrase